MVATPSADDVTHQLRELVRSARFSDALEWYRRVEDTSAGQRPDAQLLAATAATRLGEFAAAESLADLALAKFRARGDDDGRMRSLNLLGVIRFERGRLADAETVLAEALDLATRLGDSLTAARACNNLASALHLRGRPDEAVGLYRGAMLAYQRLGDRRGTAEAYHNLGLIYRQLGEWRNAEDATNEALRHATVVGERGLLALATTGRAELMAEQSDLPRARQELGRAGRWASEAGDEVGGAEVERVQALVAYKEGGLRRGPGRGGRRARHGVVLRQRRARCGVLGPPGADPQAPRPGGGGPGAPHRSRGRISRVRGRAADRAAGRRLARDPVQAARLACPATTRPRAPSGSRPRPSLPRPAGLPRSCGTSRGDARGRG